MTPEADTPEAAGPESSSKLRSWPSRLAPNRLGALSWLLALGVVALDQLSKYWVLFVYGLPARGSVEILPVFNLTMVWNRGISFGLLRSPDGQELIRWLLAAFSAAVAAVLIVWARKVERPLAAVALGLVIGGAVGNLIDRVRWGAVADFLDFSPLGFVWVFNLADSAITVGVALLLLDSLRSAPKPA